MEGVYKLVSEKAEQMYDSCYRVSFEGAGLGCSKDDVGDYFCVIDLGGLSSGPVGTSVRMTELVNSSAQGVYGIGQALYGDAE